MVFFGRTVSKQIILQQDISSLDTTTDHFYIHTLYILSHFTYHNPGHNRCNGSSLQVYQNTPWISSMYELNCEWNSKKGDVATKFPPVLVHKDNERRESRNPRTVLLSPQWTFIFRIHFHTLWGESIILSPCHKNIDHTFYAYTELNVTLYILSNLNINFNRVHFLSLTC